MKDIDPEFWHKIKLYALKNHTTIKDLILEFLKDKIKNEKES
jgi:hypothetical protein